MRLALSTDRLKKGDKIALHRDVNNYYRPNSRPLEGTVISANYYGVTDGWYIEFNSDEVGYGYWKQGSDGGELYIEGDE